LFGEIFWDKVSGTICSGTDWNQDPPVTGNMVLKITQVLASSKRIQVRGKDSVKVTVKFIRKGLHFQQTESRFSLEWELGGWGEKEERGRERNWRDWFPVSQAGNGSKTSKCWSPFLKSFSTHPMGSL
jgi:hypothetical protein